MNNITTNILSNNKKSSYVLFEDLSFWILLLSDCVTIYLAMSQHWNVSTIMWGYWFQSLFIGLFCLLRLLHLKEFTTEWLTINSKPAEPNTDTKRALLFISSILYITAHTVFFVILLEEIANDSGPSIIDWKHVGLMALMAFLTHLISYFYNKRKDASKQNIGFIAGLTIYRTLPILVVLAIVGSFGDSLAVFLVAETIADIYMHSIEHKYLKVGEKQPILKISINTLMRY